MTLSKAKRRRRRPGSVTATAVFRVRRIKASAANLTAQRTVEISSKARAAPSVGTESSLRAPAHSPDQSPRKGRRIVPRCDPGEISSRSRRGTRAGLKQYVGQRRSTEVDVTDRKGDAQLSTRLVLNEEIDRLGGAIALRSLFWHGPNAPFNLAGGVLNRVRCAAFHVLDQASNRASMRQDPRETARYPSLSAPVQS